MFVYHPMSISMCWTLHKDNIIYWIFVGFFIFLSQCYIQDHHNDKAYSKGYSADVGVFALLGLGDKLLDNNIEHSTCREGEQVG